MNDRPTPREWLNLAYQDPERVLAAMRRKQRVVPSTSPDYESRSLRSRKLRPIPEGRFAALFSHGMSAATKTKVEFALHESSDFDFVCRYTIDGATTYVPVQLKEWVPLHINATQILQEEIDKLDKYVDAQDLVVVVCLNRTVNIDVTKLRMPMSKLLELWFLVATSPDQEEFGLIGNMLV
jgi:hypothetical protein